MKKCSKCQKNKELPDFGSNRSKKDGLNCYCRACAKVKGTEYRIKYSEKVKASSEKYQTKYPEKIKTRNAEYYTNHLEEARTYGAEYYIKNRKKCDAKNTRWRTNNPDRVKTNNIKYRTEHREQINEYLKNRKKTDPCFKLVCNLRSRLHSAIKNNQKSGSAVKDLGCTVEELRLHLESQFQPGMTWDNWTRDGWHIDHVKALSTFSLTKREEFLKACNYKNLQPLWVEDHVIKTKKDMSDLRKE